MICMHVDKYHGKVNIKYENENVKQNHGTFDSFFAHSLSPSQKVKGNLFIKAQKRALMY